MARIRKRLHYADTRQELVDWKDNRRGASEDAFWDEDELVDYRSTKKNKKKKKRGCPENDFGPHVYVWVPYFTFWSDGRYEIKVCCGCEHRAPYKSFRFNSHVA